MAKIYKGALGLIGNTPLVEISNIEKELSLPAAVSCETGVSESCRKRQGQSGKRMIEDAEKKGLLKERFCDH